MSQRQMLLTEIPLNPSVKEKQTQCERLLEHFKAGGTITSYAAYLKFGITQLGRCINDLEREGYVFERPRIRLGSGKIVCRYKLKRKIDESL